MSVAKSLPISETQRPHLLSEVDESGDPLQKAPPALTVCSSNYKALQDGRDWHVGYGALLGVLQGAWTRLGVPADAPHAE